MEVNALQRKCGGNDGGGRGKTTISNCGTLGHDRNNVWLLAAVPLGRWVHHRLGEGPLTRALAVGLLIVSVRTAFVAI